MSKTLYKYYLNESDGKIYMTEINSYHTGKFTNNQSYYGFKENGYTNYVYTKDIDRFKNWKIYTFDLSESEVINIIERTLLEKQYKARVEAERYNRIINILSKCIQK